MTIDLFIRTYAKDAKWLRHAIRSIEERVTGYRNLLIACPRQDADRIARGINRPVIGVGRFGDDYVGQQHTKLTAPIHTDADVVCFWDSDTVAAAPVDLRALLFSGERLILHYVPFAGLSDGSEVWRPIMERDLGFRPENEYMRRLPLAYHRSTLIGCVQHMERLHGRDLADYMRRLPMRSFTEFNCLGAWAHVNEPGRYDFRHDEAEAAEWKRLVRQFWSWGGITPAVLQELRNYGLS